MAKNHVTKRLKSFVNRLCSFVINDKVIFQNTRRNRSQLSKVIYKASCWGSTDFCIQKTKRKLRDRKTEHFKAFLQRDTLPVLLITTSYNIKWDHFDILASGKTDYNCKVKETLFIQGLQPVD